MSLKEGKLTFSTLKNKKVFYTGGNRVGAVHVLINGGIFLSYVFFKWHRFAYRRMCVFAGLYGTKILTFISEITSYLLY